MRDEVEEFLRRAAARRAQAEAKRRAEAQQPVQLPPQRPAPIARPPLRQAMPSQLEPEVEIIEAEEADTGSRFTSSVAQHLRGTTDIARHAPSLGAEVDQADDKLEARLQRTFDHKLGALKDTTTAAPVKATTQTSEALLASMNLTRLLTNSQSIRNAIILSEVLNRPESRWD
jgi:hypothetical protein